jgi:predicted 2-oxoglutarate/Fe(II)-dependent dioxygenase YbiX
MPETSDPKEGAFEYGTHGDQYPQLHDNFPTRSIKPNVGDIVLFPSSLFHRTIPFTADAERICVAFDLKPQAHLATARSQY